MLSTRPPRLLASSRRWPSTASKPSAGGSSSSAHTSPHPPPSYSRLRKAAITTGVVGVGTVAFVWWDETYNYRTVSRNMRTAWNGVMVALDYKMNFEPDSLEAINALHERSATRLLHVCEANRGLYVKLAQALATQSAVLPPPYQKLAKLLDNAEQFEYEVVKGIVQRELGKPLEELFVRFDPVPIAAASIAQVHRARIRLPSGEEEEVAVKVQRPDIRRHAKWDLFAYRLLMRLYDRLFDLPLSFGAQYISDQILQETEFDREAKNAQKIRLLIMSSSTPLIRNTVYVPLIYPELCTPRIITMEYIEGANKLTDLKAIEAKGLNVKGVAQSVSEVFAAQIFEMGFVQADGHPSNVLIRKHPNGKRRQHQIVLIDHSFYVTLSPQFRQLYSQLWYAIFIQDLPTIQRICEGWGTSHPELFASATLLQRWRAKDRVKMKAEAKKAKDKDEPEVELTKEERELRAQRQLKEALKSFLLNAERLPKELIFVGRAMRAVEAYNQAMGSPVNRINILAKYAFAGLPRHPVSSYPVTLHTFPTLLSSTRATYISLFRLRLTLSFPVRLELTYPFRLKLKFRFHLTLALIDVVFYATKVLTWARDVATQVGLLRGWSGRRGFEDTLEDELRDMAMARSRFWMQIGDEAFEL